MKLICEVNEQDVEYITEAKENGQLLELIDGQ